MDRKYCNFFKRCCLQLHFDVMSEADEKVYEVNSDISFGILGPSGLFTQFELRKSGGKSSGNIDHPHFVSLMFKPNNSYFGQNDSSIGFKREDAGRQRESSNRRAYILATNIRV